MAPRPLLQGWSSPCPSTIVRYNGTLLWHPAMAPRPPPKWFVALPPIGSKNPYSYRYLGKKNPAEIFFRTWTLFCTKTGVLHWLNQSGSMPSWVQSTYTIQSIQKTEKAIQVELAIRWWASQDNYSQFFDSLLWNILTHMRRLGHMNMHWLNKWKHRWIIHWFPNILQGMRSSTFTSLTKGTLLV